MPTNPPPVWADYITATDAQDWCGDGTVFTSALQDIVSMACDWVQSFLSRPIGPTSMFYRFDGGSGWGGAYINLPYSPVLSITSVVEYRGTSGPVTLAESTPSSQVDGYQCEFDIGRLVRVFQGNQPRPWFPGSRNIEVTWLAGYQSPPPSVKVATLELVKHWWENSQENTGTSGGAPSPGDEYDAGSTGAGMFAGVPYRVTSMLEPQLRVGIG